MKFTEEELSVLNAFLNSSENLPVEVEALNVKLRMHFNQDVSGDDAEVAAVEAEAAPVAEAAVADVPVEAPVDAPVEAPVEETVTDA